MIISKSKIFVNDNKVKSSYLTKIGDIIEIKKKLIIITINVIKILDKRTSAKLVFNYIEDLTPDEEKMKLEVAKRLPLIYRKKGLGRPTKKERRDMMKDLENYSKS